MGGEKKEGKVDVQAAGAVASDVLSESLEDYLEAILQLERECRVARVSEIADQLNVSRPSVTGALKNLAARGLVTHEPYGHVTLTDEGSGIAVEVERRHVAIRDFLVDVLGVPAEKADVTACRLEHVVEPDVLAHFVSYAEGHEVARKAAGGKTAVGPEAAS
ncbi:MAG: metal-dependent transcriptional regulator [Thermoleophilia bacterium]|nr:metal-dependent transcriptional regulator [Thermoleophilia bacterium]